MTELPGTTAEFELADVRKRYGATQALAGVSLRLHRGEFVALLGPNGAGKSTLIKVLDGKVVPDSGTVTVSNGRDALGVVHQDLGLIETLTVVENLELGKSRRWLRLRDEVADARVALAQVGLATLDPHTVVESLSLGRRTMVAVAKLLQRGARVIVVDEVTAGLAPSEARWLVGKLRDAAHTGATVMMVTHKLREVIGIADRYVVMVDGAVALDVPAETTSHDELVAVMSAGRGHSRSGPTGAAVAERHGALACRLSAATNDRVGPVDLELAFGEVVGITGLVGSGLHDIAYFVAGRAQLRSGEVWVAPGLRRSCVPAHRESEGVFAEESEEFNLTTGWWRRWTGATGVLSLSAMRTDAEAMSERLSIVPRDLGALVGGLSGGNQQKVVLGRALIGEPGLLVLCEPTRGVDVATRRDIYAEVRRVAAAGAAVLVASSDLEDIVELADRGAVLGDDGRLGGWVGRADLPELAGALV